MNISSITNNNSCSGSGKDLDNEPIILHISMNTINEVIFYGNTLYFKILIKGHLTKYSYSLNKVESTFSIKVPLQVGNKSHTIYLNLLNSHPSVQKKWNCDSVVVKAPLMVENDDLQDLKNHQPLVELDELLSGQDHNESVVMHLGIRSLKKIVSGKSIQTRMPSRILGEITCSFSLNKRIDPNTKKVPLYVDFEWRTLYLTLLSSPPSVQKKWQDTKVVVKTPLKEDALRKFIEKDDLDGLKECQEKQWIEDKTPSGYTPLHLACIYESENIVKWLLDGGADPNITTNFGDTPLHLAIENQQFAIVKILLNANVDVNKVNAGGTTPLQQALIHCNKEIVELLKDKVASLNIANLNCAKESDNCSNTIQMSQKNKDELSGNKVKNQSREKYSDEKIPSKIDLSMPPGEIGEDDKYHIELTRLIKKHRMSIDGLEKLLNQVGHDVERVDTNGDTLLHIMVDRKAYTFVEYVIDKNLVYDIDVPNADGETALFLATKNLDLKMISILMRLRPDPSISNMDDETIFDLLLLRAGEANKRKRRGNTGYSSADIFFYYLKCCTPEDLESSFLKKMTRQRQLKYTDRAVKTIDDINLDAKIMLLRNYHLKNLMRKISPQNQFIDDAAVKLARKEVVSLYKNNENYCEIISYFDSFYDFIQGKISADSLNSSLGASMSCATIDIDEQNKKINRVASYYYLAIADRAFLSRIGRFKEIMSEYITNDLVLDQATELNRHYNRLTNTENILERIKFSILIAQITAAYRKRLDPSKRNNDDVQKKPTSVTIKTSQWLNKALGSEAGKRYDDIILNGWNKSSNQIINDGCRQSSQLLLGNKTLVRFETENLVRHLTGIYLDSANVIENINKDFKQVVQTSPKDDVIMRFVSALTTIRWTTGVSEPLKEHVKGILQSEYLIAHSLTYFAGFSQDFYTETVPSTDNLINKAKFEKALALFSLDNNYNIIDVNREYRKLASAYHPDRWAKNNKKVDGSEEMKEKEMTEKMQQINNAKEILLDVLKWLC